MSETIKESSNQIEAGNLAEQPFARIFYQLAQEKRTGFLDILPGPIGESKPIKRIMMVKGGSFYVQGGTQEETLARILVVQGKLNEGKYQSLKDKAGGDYKKLEELALKETGLNPEQLGELYQYQVELKIKNCFALVRGYYQFKSAEQSALQKYPLIPLSPEKLILAGVELHFSRARIEKEFAGIEKKSFKIKPELGSNLEFFGFGPKEIRWLRQLGKEFVFGNGIRSSNLPSEQAEQILLALYLAEALELPKEEEDFPLGRIYEAPEEKISPKEAVKPVIKGEEKKEAKKEETKLAIEEMLDKEMTDQELLKEVDKMLDKASEKETTYFELLGVDELTPPVIIKRIYFKMAKVFHPDAKPNLYKGEVREKVESLFTKISEAYNSLSDSEQRRAYVERIKSKVSEEQMEQASRAIQAEMEFNKALIMIRRGAFRDARPIMEEVVKLAPEEPEFRIHLAYCVFKTEGVSSARKNAQIIENELQKRPKLAEGWFYLGMINRVMGELEKAKEYFQKTLELEKYHQEAQRELRVIEMKLAEQAGKGKKRK